MIQFDLLNDELPKAQCLMMLWLINHMPEDSGLLAMNKILESDAKYLIYTHSDRLFGFHDLPYIDSVQIRDDTEIRLAELC